MAIWIFDDYQSLFESLLVLIGLLFAGWTIFRNSSSLKTSLLHDLAKEERDLRIKIYNITVGLDKLKNETSIKKDEKIKLLKDRRKFLIETHLNFFEHIGILVFYKKIKEKITKEYFRDVIIQTYDMYSSIKDDKEVEKLLKKYDNAIKLYNRWKNQPQKSERTKFYKQCMNWTIFILICSFFLVNFFYTGLILGVSGGLFNLIIEAIGVIIIALIINYSPPLKIFRNYIYESTSRRLITHLAILMIVFVIFTLYILYFWIPNLANI